MSQPAIPFFTDVYEELLTSIINLKSTLNACETFNQFMSPTKQKLPILLNLLFSSGQVTQEVGALSCNHKAVGSISGQGTYLGCAFDPRSRHMWEATYQHFSLTWMFLPPSPSKSNEKCP